MKSKIPARADSKHQSGRIGKRGGPKVDRLEKRKRKAAEKSRRRNRK